MKTDIALDKLCELVPIISDVRPKLKQDEELKSLVLSIKQNESGIDNITFTLKIAPIMLKTYRQEIYEILAIITDKTVEEIADQDFFVTVNELRDLLANEEARRFFTLLLTTKE